MRQLIIGQPYGTLTLADWLRDKLGARVWQRIVFAVATVTDDGLDELWSELWVSTNRGGQLILYVGIDLGMTDSVLKRLLSLPNTSVYIVHDGSNTVTYHPKLYILESNDQAAIAIGSANLTSLGLNSNFELTLAVELDLPSEAYLLQQAKDILDSWTDPAKGLCQQLNQHVLNSLTSSGMLTSPLPPPGRRLPTHATFASDVSLFRPVSAVRQPAFRPRFFFMTVLPGDLPQKGSSPEIRITKYLRWLQQDFWGPPSSYTYNPGRGSWTRRVTILFHEHPMDAELRDLPARKPDGTKASADYRLGNIGPLWWELNQPDDIVMLERLDNAATRYRAEVIRVGSPQHAQLYAQMKPHPRARSGPYVKKYLYV